jgi:hypothetical protein
MAPPTPRLRRLDLADWLGGGAVIDGAAPPLRGSTTRSPRHRRSQSAPPRPGNTAQPENTDARKVIQEF